MYCDLDLCVLEKNFVHTVQAIILCQTAIKQMQHCLNFPFSVLVIYPKFKTDLIALL